MPNKNRKQATGHEPMLVTMPQLKERGWTETRVKKFLDPPDATRPNPHYRSAAPMRLYAIARVEAAESREDWKQAALRSRGRSEAGKAVAARKAAELVKAVKQLPITVTRLPPDQLLEQAITSYNEFHEELLWERGHDYEPAHAGSDLAFLARITVNYIRHHLTAYDTHLEEVAGRIGVRQAIAAIRYRVYAAIEETYPDLAEECQRQIQSRVLFSVPSSGEAILAPNASHEEEKEKL